MKTIVNIRPFQFKEEVMFTAKKFIPVLLVLVFVSAGCSLTGTSGTPDIEMVDLSGTWTGILDESSGAQRNITLVISHNPPASEITGNITIAAGDLVEQYDISGTFDSATLHFTTVGYGLNYTADYTPGALDGYIAWDCYDCPDQSVGTFSLSQGAPGLPPAAANLSGTWGGTMTDSNGIWDITLVVSHAPPASEITGTITLAMGDYAENYEITGTFDGATLHFAETEGRHFTATYASGTLTGYIAWNCYDCPDQSVGTFTLSQGAPPPPASSGEPERHLDRDAG